MDSNTQLPIETGFEKAAIHVADLPALELYIDQVITLIEQGYAPNKRSPEEKPLTKMMINNYSKAGLVRPIKGKKYTREHIVQILIIYALKGTLSINEIKGVLDVLYTQPDFNSDRLFSCYENSLTLQENSMASLEELLASSGLLSKTDPSERFASLMAICAMSESLSTLAGRLVAQYFPTAAQHSKNTKAKK